MPLADRDAYLAFFRAAERLKDTFRSGRTSSGRRESTAEHCWRLCLMAVTLGDELPAIDLRRLLELLVLHDLGEAVHGDIPAGRTRPPGSGRTSPACSSRCRGGWRRG